MFIKFVILVGPNGLILVPKHTHNKYMFFAAFTYRSISKLQLLHLYTFNDPASFIPLQLLQSLLVIKYF